MVWAGVSKKSVHSRQGSEDRQWTILGAEKESEKGTLGVKATTHDRVLVCTGGYRERKAAAWVGRRQPGDQTSSER